MLGFGRVKLSKVGVRMALLLLVAQACHAYLPIKNNAALREEFAQEIAESAIDPQIDYNEPYIRAVLERANADQQNNYPDVVELACHLSDALYMLIRAKKSANASLQRNDEAANEQQMLMLQARQAIKEFLSKKKYVLVGQLKYWLESSESLNVKNWQRWTTFINEHFEAQLSGIDDDEVAEHLNPRQDANLSRKLMGLIDIDDLNGQRAFTHGKGFCILTQYLDGESDIFKKDSLDLTISRILYLYGASFEQKLFKEAQIHPTSHLKAYHHLITLCKHMNSKPLPPAADLIFELQAYNAKLIQDLPHSTGFGTQSIANRKLEQTCDARISPIYEQIGEYDSKVTHIAFNEKLDYHVSWIQMLKDELDETKKIVIVNCRELLDEKLVEGLKPELLREEIPADLLLTKDNTDVKKREDKLLLKLVKAINTWLEIVSKMSNRTFSSIQELIRYHAADRKFRKFADKKQSLSSLLKFDRDYVNDPNSLQTGITLDQNNDKGFKIDAILNPRRDTALNIKLAETVSSNVFAQDAYRTGNGLCSVLRNNDKLDYVYKTFKAFLVYMYPHKYMIEMVQHKSAVAAKSPLNFDDPTTISDLMKFNFLMVVCEQLQRDPIEKNNDASKITWRVKNLLNPKTSSRDFVA